MKKCLLVLLVSINVYGSEDKSDGRKGLRGFIDRLFDKKGSRSSKYSEDRFPIAVDDSGAVEVVHSGAVKSPSYNRKDLSITWTNRLPDAVVVLRNSDLISEAIDKSISWEPVMGSYPMMKRDDENIRSFKTKFDKTYQNLKKMMNHVLKVNKINQEAAPSRERVVVDKERLIQGYEGLENLDHELFVFTPSESLSKKFLVYDRAFRKEALRSKTSSSSAVYEVSVVIDCKGEAGFTRTTYIRTLLEKYDLASNSFVQVPSSMAILKVTKKVNFAPRAPQEEPSDFDLHGWAAY